MHLGSIRVKPQSSIKAVWECNKCPAGQLHIWAAWVHNRSRGKQCPYCTNKRVCLHNSLATMAPDVAQYWNHSKNDKAPDQVLAGSHIRAEWKCPACNKGWQATVVSRTHRNAGCPKCSQKSTTRQSQPTFAEAQPAELAEWDHERNGGEDIFLENTTLGSGKQVHWICSCCPKGQPHRWTAAPHNRIGLNSGCAVCAGLQACACNSLESLCPDIAAEFDVNKNGFAPSEITAQSHKQVWWRNAARGSWRQSPNRRTDKRNKPFPKQVQPCFPLQNCSQRPAVLLTLLACNLLQLLGLSIIGVHAQ